MRMIEADKVIPLVRLLLLFHPNAERIVEDMQAVVDSHTIEAEPVRHGRWSLAEDGDGVVCSCCGKDLCNLVYETDDFNYCPHCGARMDGDSHDTK